jgi:hypothetical protein
VTATGGRYERVQPIMDEVIGDWKPLPPDRRVFHEFWDLSEAQVQEGLQLTNQDPELKEMTLDDLPRTDSELNGSW